MCAIEIFDIAKSDSFGGFISIPLFIAKSFMFEVIFDLGHYWLHRGAHFFPAIYRTVHKKHHKYHHPRAETSFYLNVSDVVLTYGAPLAMGLSIVPFTRFEFCLLTVYLTCQEIGGHLGKQMTPTSSFAQCVWLPRVLQIELYTEDHDLHHSALNCNYSKRFSMWDKIFGTYRRKPQGKAKEKRRENPKETPRETFNKNFCSKCQILF